VLVTIQGKVRSLILDSGSVCSVLKRGRADAPLESTSFEPFGVTGHILNVAGEQEVFFRMEAVTFRHSF
jgi:hypothetical protein